MFDQITRKFYLALLFHIYFSDFFSNTVECEDIFIYFIYVSIASPEYKYTINGFEPIQQLYEYIEKINSIFKGVINNYKIIVFDVDKPADVISNDSHILYYDIEKKEIIDMVNGLKDINNKKVKSWKITNNN